MERETLLNSTWKTLRNSKLVWIFTFVEYIVLAFLPTGDQNPSLMSLLFCCIDLIWLALYLVIPIAIATTMYHGYLGESLSLKQVLADVRKYLFRWLGLFVLVWLPVLTLSVLLERVANTINFMLYLFILNLLACYFATFFTLYLQIGMIRYNLGVRDALKHGARVWASRPRTKALIALIYSLTQLILGLLIVITQKGHPLMVFSTSHQEYLALFELPGPHLLVYIYYALSAPVLCAFVTSTYFRDARSITSSDTNLISLDDSNKVP